MSVQPTPDPASPQLSITHGPIDAGAGHRGMPVIFTNVGETTLSLSGYPQVVALNANGEPVAQARPEPSGYLGGLKDGFAPPAIELLPGESASAMVEAIAFESPMGTAVTPYVSILVTLPGESHAINLDWEDDGGSELQIHPVVPGVTGQQP